MNTCLKIFFILFLLQTFKAASAQIVIVSNGTWKASSSLNAGWQNVGFNDAAWVYATSPAPHGCTPVINGTQSMWWSNASVTDVYFRKKFILLNPVTAASAQITADNEFQLYINGAYVGTGNSWSTFYNFNIQSFLQCDTNEIAIHGIEWVPGTCNLVTFKAVVDTANMPASTINASICQGATYQLPGGIIVNTQGVYKDTIQASSGCDSIVVTNLNLNIASYQNITAAICSGSVYQLPNGNIVNSAGLYHDTLQTINGCDSIIATNLNLYPILIPNVFTPNDDGYNDTYQIDSLCAGDLHFIIYNRWGKKMFETRDKNFHWDGTAQDGNEAADGIYYFMLAYISKEYHGIIELIRK